MAKSKLKVKVLVCKVGELEEKLQNWLDENPGQEEIKLQVPISIGQFVLLIILYKVSD